MFKVRTVSLGRILTFSTAVLYLGYLWYKRKRVSSHRQSDKKRLGSEPSELTKIDDQELLQALEKASHTLEVSQIVEEEPIDSSVISKEIMEPTLCPVKMREVQSFLENSDLLGLDTNINNMSSKQQECLESKLINTIESLAENLSNLKLGEELENETKLVQVLEDSIDSQQEEESIKKEEQNSEEKTSWTEMVENEDHCECPKSVFVKKVKKDEEPMLFEGIKFKGKKKRGRKKNQARDTVQLSSESHNRNKTNNVVKSVKKKIIQVVEEDCDSAHSVDHSIDTNDAPNTIYSDIRSEVSFIHLTNLYIPLIHYCHFIFNRVLRIVVKVVVLFLENCVQCLIQMNKQVTIFWYQWIW